jgi:hypothetical protein
VEPLEDRRLLSADLTPSFSGAVPAVLTAGAPAKVAVRVANVGDVRASGAAQVTLYASADGMLDAGDTPVGDAVRALKLKPGKSTAVKVALQAPGNLPAGDYTLLACVETGSSAIQDANAANDMTTAALLVRQPVVDLSGRFVALPDAPLEAFQGGRTDSTTVEVANIGNSPLRQAFDVTVYLSTDTTLDGADVVLGNAGVRRTTTIKPGASKDVKVTLQLPSTGTPAGRYTLIAKVDRRDDVAESDETNNVVASPGQVPVVDQPPPPIDGDGHGNHHHGYYWTDGPIIDTYYYYDDGEWVYTDEVIEVPPGDTGGNGPDPEPTPDDYGGEVPGEDPDWWPPEDDTGMRPPSSQPTTEPAPEPEPVFEPAPEPEPAPTPESDIWDDHPAPGDDVAYYE